MPPRLLAPRTVRVTRATVCGGVLPGRLAGGDWFDVADNVDGTWLAAADPGGSGPGSVGLGLAALAALRGARHDAADVAAVATAMHDEIAAVGDGAEVRAFLARWHAPTATLAWVNCGYPPAHFVSLEHGPVALKGLTYAALGAGGQTARYESRLARLERGDRLVVASDGMLPKGRAVLRPPWSGCGAWSRGRRSRRRRLPWLRSSIPSGHGGYRTKKSPSWSCRSTDRCPSPMTPQDPPRCLTSAHHSSGERAGSGFANGSAPCFIAMGGAGLEPATSCL